ncbi:hypothetical protein DITRI_Ditri20bG0139100 [Diplodiscus trichospermus]
MFNDSVIEIKLFGWRLCKEILPTYGNLQRRRCIADPSCPICEAAVETNLYAVKDCFQAREVWREFLEKDKWLRTNAIEIVDWLGEIARDIKGEVWGAWAFKAEHIGDPSVNEVKAAWKALTFAKDMGFQRIVLEGDALAITNRLKSGEKDLSTLGAVIEDIKHMANEFQFCCFQFGRRCANRAAHLLARNALEVDHDMYWVEDYPQCNVNIVQMDMLCAFF